MSAPSHCVDVVIVAYNSVDSLEACVTSVVESDEVASVTVIDHSATPVLAHLPPMVRIVHDPSNPGFGAGQNRGLRLGSAPFALLLNPDAELAPGAVADGVRALLDDARIGACEGVVLGADGTPERSQGVELGPLHLWGRALGLRHFRERRFVKLVVPRLFPSLSDHIARVPVGPRDVAALAATALLVRREAMESVGGFDEEYFLYGEDIDLCRRLRGAGWRLVAVDRVWARHLGGGSSATTFDREIEWWRGTMRFAARWWSGPRWWSALLAALVRSLRLVAHRPTSFGRVLRALVADSVRARRASVSSTAAAGSA